MTFMIRNFIISMVAITRSSICRKGESNCRHVAIMAVILALVLHQFDAVSVSSRAFQFSFSSFPPSSIVDLTVLGDAQPTSNGVLQMTRDGQNISLQSSSGRAFYSKPIALWSSSSNDTASFNTSFSFTIQNITAAFGDGMSFLMASAAAPPPRGSEGGMLGLCTSMTSGSPNNHFVAVEFDTYENMDSGFKFMDIDGNHVGIDINGIVSQKAVSLDSLGMNLKSGRIITAWIDYDGHGKQLDVYLSYNSTKPSSPLLSDVIDLSQYILPNMYLGFTGATGKSFELHDVHSWSFAGTELIAQSPSISPSPGVSLSHPPATRSSVSKSMMVLVVTLGISFVIGGASFLILLRYYNHKKKRIVLPVGKSIKDASIDPSAFILTADFLYGPRKFTYKELSMATNHFSQKQELGRGGFGSVYKGIVPGDGTMIAVKRTSKTSSQGEREFVAEVSIIGRLRHRNLVPLLGWCHGKGDLLLVYEFMPNGSLDKLLFGSKGEFLDWPRRYKIVCGLAAALLYLHEEWEDQVVHRDVKASNVMLDANFTARLGDFGLARLIEHNKNAETTLAAGTLGYLAPEVSQTGKATTKSDVYSFGAVALEVACGRRPIDRTLPAEETILLEWVWSLQARGRITDAVDARLEASSIVSSELQCLLQLGLACSHPDPEARPTIRQVLQILKGDAALPAIPSSKPVPNYYHFSFQDLFVEMAHDTTATDASAAATGMESISFTDSETANSIDSDTPARVPEAGTALLR